VLIAPAEGWCRWCRSVCRGRAWARRPAARPRLDLPQRVRWGTSPFACAAVDVAAYRPGKFLNAAVDKRATTTSAWRSRLRRVDGRVIGCVQIAGWVRGPHRLHHQAGRRWWRRALRPYRFGAAPTSILPPGARLLVATQHDRARRSWPNSTPSRPDRAPRSSSDIKAHPEERSAGPRLEVGYITVVAHLRDGAARLLRVRWVLWSLRWTTIFALAAAACAASRSIGLIPNVLTLAALCSG